MKNKLFLFFVITSTILFHSRCFADVEADLRQFGQDFIKHRNDFVGFLDTNSLVDAKDFIKILKSDDDILNNFNQLFMKFHYKNTNLQFQHIKYCNTKETRYRLVFNNIGQNIGYEAISFITQSDSLNSKKLKLFTVTENKFLNSMFEDDVDEVEDEIEELLDVDFDLEKYFKESNRINFSEFLDTLKANKWKQSGFESFKQKLREEGGKIKNTFASDYYFNSRDSILYPTIWAIIKIGDEQYTVYIQRRNCTCNEKQKPEYYFIKIGQISNI